MVYENRIIAQILYTMDLSMTTMNKQSTSCGFSKLQNNGTCFIIPLKYFEDKIKEGKTAKEREKALSDLKLSQFVRGKRVATARHPLLNASPLQEERRMIYDMQEDNNENDLPGNLVRAEGAANTGDNDVDNVYTGVGNVYNFYKQNFNRNSIDNNGMTLVNSVHFADPDTGQGWDNAMWDGTQMVYGDGDDQSMHAHMLTGLQDVTAHELTHGVTQNTSGLPNQGQSGGVNEHISDCFGIMCLQWVNNQTIDQADWLIGKGLMIRDDGTSGALRSMKDPGNASQTYPGDGSIKNISDYFDGIDVHFSCGIGNYAFYLACKGVGGSGHSWDKMGKVWYITNTTRLNQQSVFQDVANNTFDVAGSLFGQGGNEQNAVRDAWHQVGLEATTPPATLTVNHPLNPPKRK